MANILKTFLAGAAPAVVIAGALRAEIPPAKTNPLDVPASQPSTPSTQPSSPSNPVPPVPPPVVIVGIRG